MKLGEISDFEGGSQPPKSAFIDQPKSGYIRLLQIRDFKSDHRAVYVPISKKNRTCKSDDLMIGRYGASVGQILKGKAGAYNVALIKAVPNPKFVDSAFFYFYLTSRLFQDNLFSVADRSAQAGFSKPDIAQFDVPLPPIPEQKRIVAILDEAFEGIDTAVANAKKNLANARELFENYLCATFSMDGDGWLKTTLGALCESVEYGTATKSLPEGQVPVLRMGNIQNGNLTWDELVYTSDVDEIAKYALKPGDVLFNRTNSAEHVGKSAIYRGEQPAVFAGYLFRVHYKEEYLEGEFLNYFLNSPIARDHGKSVMSQSVNQANISGSKLKEYPIALPSLSKQREIAAKLHRLKAHSSDLAILYRSKLEELQELKQSILEKAFAGELTVQPERILEEARA